MLGTTLLYFIIATTCFIILRARRRRTQNVPLPPGPKPDPLIGHLRMMPTDNQADVFREWAKTYGDVIYLEVLGRKIVVLDKIEDARALLENRGSKYCCRPELTTVPLMGWNRFLVFMPYGPQFLKHRKMIQQYFGRKETMAFTPIVLDETRLLIKNLHQSASGRHLDYVRRCNISCIMRVVFGHQVKSDDDNFMAILHRAAYGINNCGQGGNTVVDTFPWLRHFPSWFPGTHYATLARSCYPAVRELHDVTVNSVRAGIANKTVQKCFVSDKLEEMGPESDLDVEDIKGAAATIFIATDTAFMVLSVFLLAMTLNPECQRRAYEEIISVVGQDRLPDLRDRDSLPYLESVMQETFRWHTVTPLVPHRLIEDDVYNGMFIPEDTLVLANARSMSRNEAVYHDPETFDPTRYLPSPEGRAEPHLPSVWGFGRRICPGKYFGDMVVWSAMACILATYEILPPKDEKGNVVLPELKPMHGLIAFVQVPPHRVVLKTALMSLTNSGIAPFDFEVRTRSEKAASLVGGIE
ncbi:cytochrome P450 [Marasmius fiardii PR-910]|nr:cytochrome P450 [Marasmius fiardii PR-910]